MTNYYLQKLTRIAPLTGHGIEATFHDGFTAKLDLRPWIERGGIRAALTDPEVFDKVFVNEFGVAEWPRELDLSPGTLRAWCEGGRVLNKPDTDEWIAQHSEKTPAAA